MVDNTMKLKITLSQLPVIPPIREEVYLPKTDIDTVYSVTYNLTNNCSTTNKFIDLCSHALHTSVYWCSYNIYKDNTKNDYKNSNTSLIEYYLNF